MASLTFVVDKQLKSDIEHFAWVNWSEVNREELNKKRIFEEFLKTGSFSDEDENFCEKIDWHPVDELPMKKEYIEKLKKIDKKPSNKSMDIGEFNKWCESL